MKKVVYIAVLLLTLNCQGQEVPFLFKLQSTRPTTPLPVEVIMFDAAGTADTLCKTTLRTSSPSVRRDKNYNAYTVTRRVDRRLPVQGPCRLLFRVDKDTISLRFPVEVSSVGYGIEALLTIDCFDSSSVEAYPVVNVYRGGDSLGRLFYVGFDKPTYEKAPENKRRPFFNFQSVGDQELYAGSWQFRLYVIDETQLDSGQPFFSHSYDFLYERTTVLLPHQSMRFSQNAYYFSPGKNRAYIVFSTDYRNTFSRRVGGCRPIRYSPDEKESIWHDVRVQTWYVTTCDFHLTTLDLEQ